VGALFRGGGWFPPPPRAPLTLSTGQSCHDNSSYLPHQPSPLHWLKIKQRIEYKIIWLTYTALQHYSPSCLIYKLKLQSSRATRSSSAFTVHRPWNRLSFMFAAPRWFMTSAASRRSQNPRGEHGTMPPLYATGWTSTPEAWVQIRVAAIQIIYYLAYTVLWHKDDSNMACAMYAFWLIICIRVYRAIPVQWRSGASIPLQRPWSRLSPLYPYPVPVV